MTADLTLAEVRLALAPKIARAAAFDGWTSAAVEMAAQEAGIDPGTARIAFPGGAMDMVDAWTLSVDAAMAEALPWIASVLGGKSRLVASPASAPAPASRA